MKTVIIDFQGYVNPIDSFIVKELTIIDAGCSTLYHHWIFKPPTYYREGAIHPTNKWVYHNLHGIKWEDGDVEYSELNNLMRAATNQYTYIFAKGLEKCKYLENVIGKDVLDLQDFNCPALSNLPELEYTSKKCWYHHNRKMVCSLKHSQQLVTWMFNNRTKVDLNEAAVREKTFVRWKGTLAPEYLAFHGFIHTRHRSVKCVYCNVEFPDNLNKCPCLLHKKDNPYCIFIVNNRINK